MLEALANLLNDLQPVPSPQFLPDSDPATGTPFQGRLAGVGAPGLTTFQDMFDRFSDTWHEEGGTTRDDS